MTNEPRSVEQQEQQLPLEKAAKLDDKWIENFYKECGREVTLAYTTLNQMKNWAIVIAGALLSGFAFGTSAITGSMQNFQID